MVFQSRRHTFNHYILHHELQISFSLTTWRFDAQNWILLEDEKHMHKKINTHRTVRTQSLHTSRIVVLNTTARFSLHVSGFLDQLDNLSVLANAGGKLGSQVNEVFLERNSGTTNDATHNGWQTECKTFCSNYHFVNVDSAVCGNWYSEIQWILP